MTRFAKAAISIFSLSILCILIALNEVLLIVPLKNEALDSSSRIMNGQKNPLVTPPPITFVVLDKVVPPLSMTVQQSSSSLPTIDGDRNPSPPAPSPPPPPSPSSFVTPRPTFSAVRTSVHTSRPTSPPTTSPSSSPIKQQPTTLPRVLVIVYGSMRGGPLAWQSLESNVLDVLGADLALLGPSITGGVGYDDCRFYQSQHHLFHR